MILPCLCAPLPLVDGNWKNVEFSPYMCSGIRKTLGGKSEVFGSLFFLPLLSLTGLRYYIPSSLSYIGSGIWKYFEVFTRGMNLKFVNRPLPPPIDGTKKYVNHLQALTQGARVAGDPLLI